MVNIDKLLGRLAAGFCVVALVLVVSGNASGQDTFLESVGVESTGQPGLGSHAERAGYSFGQTAGRSILARIGTAPGPIDREAILLGITDVLRNMEPRMTEAEMREAMRTLGQAARNQGEAAVRAQREATTRNQAARRAMEEERNRNAEARQRAGVGRDAVADEAVVAPARPVGVGDEGRRFLESNARAQGVNVTPSGLQYKVLIEGGGARPNAGDRLTVHYIGKYVDGSVFETTLTGEREPILFTVDQVIPGWREAFGLMRVGDRWELYLPSALAFGVEGRSGKVEPDQVVVYEVQLMGVEPGGDGGGAAAE